VTGTAAFPVKLLAELISFGHYIHRTHGNWVSRLGRRSQQKPWTRNKMRQPPAQEQAQQYQPYQNPDERFMAPAEVAHPCLPDDWFLYHQSIFGKS